MPWYWYSMLKCTEIYRGGKPFECLDTCNGPVNYVDHLMKDPDYNVTGKLWIYDCWLEHKSEIQHYTNVVDSHTFRDKYLNHQMQWGNKLNFSDSIAKSISVHCKDSIEMVNWQEKAASILLDAGCSEKSCKDASVEIMRDKLYNWTQ